MFLFLAFDIHSVSFEIIFKGSRERFVRLKAMFKCDINNFFHPYEKVDKLPGLTSSSEHTPLPYHLLTPGIHDENATQKNLQCELNYAVSVFHYIFLNIINGPLNLCFIAFHLCSPALYVL